MKERLDKIRRLLSELEDARWKSERHPPGEDRDFSALELPLIIQEIVDDLQPLLSPYEAAFYWYAFPYSIAKNGAPLVRISTRGLQKGVVKSSYSTAAENMISQEKVREVLRALEALGAIRKQGEPNRDEPLSGIDP